MKRKTIKTRTGAYHVTLPIRLVEEFDESLDYKQSRSKLIADLMQSFVDGKYVPITTLTTQQLLAACMARFEPGSLEAKTLETIFETIFQKHDEQSS